jgi:inner membrane protein
MIAGTHIAFASALHLGGAALFEYDTNLVGWVLAAGASLLPDVDLPTSKLGRVLFWLSTRLEKRFGHRTMTHSFIALIVLALLASPLLFISPLYFGCILGG